MPHLFRRFVPGAILGLILGGLFACGGGEGTPVSPGSSMGSVVTSPSTATTDPEHATRDNAQLVVEALRVWSVYSNKHAFPAGMADVNSRGDSLRDLLPEGLLLINPFTGQRTEPSMEDVYVPGHIFFGAGEDSTGPTRGVQVKAYGRQGLIWSQWIQTSLFEERDRRTFLNGEIVKIAVEDWAKENGGTYPFNIYQLNRMGHSVIDLLPGEHLLVNAFTFMPTEPVDGLAACAGQIGYMVTVKDRINMGYVINAFGLHEQIGVWVHDPWEGSYPPSAIPDALPPEPLDPELITLRNAVAVRAAIERWSSENGGGYPPTLITSNRLGNMVIDLLPGGVRLLNPYTGVRSEPRDGAPTRKGQVGYLGIAGSKGQTSYCIEARGNNGVLWRYAHVPATD